MKWEALKEGQDYQFFRNEADANPFGLQILNTSLMEEPLFLVVECPYSAPYGLTVNFSAETDETDCPLDLLMGQAKILLGERYPQKFPGLAQLGVWEKVNILKGKRNPLPPKTSGWRTAFRGGR